MPIFDRTSRRSMDWALFVTVIFLSAIGFAAIYSVDLSRGAELIYTKKQLFAFAIGLVLLVTAGFTQYTFFKNYAKWWYFFSLILLVAVLFLGRTIRGTTGWFPLGGFSFQPVEFAKIGLILMLAYIISRFGRRFDQPLFFFGTGAVTLLPVVLVLFQPDLGSAILLAVTWFALMLLSGARKTHLLILVAGVVAIGAFSWFFLFQDYQKERLLTFVDPQRDPLGSGYNIIQSTIAVGSGGAFGRGLGFGSQSQLRFLPETQTDFIFSVVGEELGLAGVIVLLGLYVLLLYRLITLAARTDDDFVALSTAGFAILFFIQFFINIGANVGLLPVTGVTLPFVSYGGSSLIMSLLMVGIAESMAGKRV
ncbi:MAG: rod shape-determining protein RodA [Patescibacteria group bacterium]|nr:rod shape-determining protein RodA [Patescibacteria group bacterium]